MVAADAALIVACYYLAYLIRFEFVIPESYLNVFLMSMPYVLCVKLGSFAFFHLYRGVWRYTSLVDFVNVVRAVLVASVLIITGILVLHRFDGYPRSVFLMDGALTLLAIGGLRVMIRFYYARGSRTGMFPSFQREKHSGPIRLLIVGAGDAGEQMLREIWNNPGVNFQPVGIIDDDQDKQGKSIHSVRVLGTIDDIDHLGVDFDEILIAIPSAKGDDMRRIVDACDRSGKRYRTIPGIGELINGSVSVKAIREVTLEDLIGRQEVHIDEEGIAGYLKQKRVLVTGAGGSIGSELVRQIGRFDPEALALVEASELNLFQSEMECRERFGSLDISAFLADVRHRKALSKVFREFRPQVIFHAAAYKHVPIQELYPWEAVYNNVIGTRNLVEEAVDKKVERFVFVSTDKAVRPTNVMGATKRLDEMLVQCSAGKSKTRFMAVRFGNVMGSSGSAIPVFQEQIVRGGPVTVTHPEVTRYFMTISEACQLILQAGAMGERGEIFILDMGKPVRILDLAKDLIRLHGFEPDREISIQFIGLRPGEKLHEELITEGEGIVATAHEKIHVLRGNHCDPQELNAKIDELLAVVRSYDALAIKTKLQQIVPDYTPQLSAT